MMPTVLQTPVTIWAEASWAASRTSLVSVPAEMVAVPEGRSTVTELRARVLMIGWALLERLWMEVDKAWEPDWARKGIL